MVKEKKVKIEINGKTARSMMKEVHEKRISAVKTYYRELKEELEAKYIKENPITEDDKLDAGAAAAILLKIFKKFNIEIKMEGGGSHTFYRRIDEEKPESVKIELSNGRYLNTESTEYSAAKIHEKEKNLALEHENEMYFKTLELLKGVRTKDKIIEIVKISYDLDLEKYDYTPIKPDLVKNTFDKKFCEVLKNKKGD